MSAPALRTVQAATAIGQRGAAFNGSPTNRQSAWCQHGRKKQDLAPMMLGRHTRAWVGKQRSLLHSCGDYLLGVIAP